MDDYPFIRHLKPPVTAEQLCPLDARCKLVQFSASLSEPEMRAVARFLRDYPKVTVRVYRGRFEDGCDFGFLKHFGFLRRLQADVFDIKNFSGMACLSSDLEYLGIGEAQPKKHSLSFLKRFSSLRELYIDGQTKDIEVIGELVTLEDLTLRSVTLPNLSILRSLENLRSLDLKLGGTKDLSLLPEIGKLRYLEIWAVRGLADLTAIAQVQTLQYLFLQDLAQVTDLPSFQGLRLLRRVHLQTLKKLTDLQAVADAPSLEELVVAGMLHLKPDALRPFVGHPALKRVTIGLGSKRKNEIAKELVGGLPDVTHGTDFQFT